MSWLPYGVINNNNNNNNNKEAVGPVGPIRPDLWLGAGHLSGFVAAAVSSVACATCVFNLIPPCCAAAGIRAVPRRQRLIAVNHGVHRRAIHRHMSPDARADHVYRQPC